MATNKRPYNGPYRGEHLNHVAFPLGGIGAGMICLEGTGAFSHVSLRGQPDVFHEPMMFAALCVKGRENTARVLAGPVPDWKVFFPWDQKYASAGNGGSGKTYGLPRCASAEFEPRFPFGVVRLADPKVPLAMEITGWSPFIPGDADNSSLPVAALEYRFTNTGAEPVEAIFSFHAQNFMALRSWGAGSAGVGDSAVRATEGGFVLWQGPGVERPWDQAAFSATVDDSAVKVNCAWFRGGWFDPLTVLWKTVQEGAAPEAGPAAACTCPSPSRRGRRRRSASGWRGTCPRPICPTARIRRRARPRAPMTHVAVTAHQSATRPGMQANSTTSKR
jgi:hypothetical protein